jgi:hypothetical protein
VKAVWKGLLDNGTITDLNEGVVSQFGERFVNECKQDTGVLNICGHSSWILQIFGDGNMSWIEVWQCTASKVHAGRE